MKLDSYIKEYLVLNNNVIVKGFGSFEKVLESAVIDEKSGEIRPPHMTIKFDASLKIDSGSLSKFISGKEKISHEDAVKKINEEVSSWNNDLKAGKLINLDGIGIVSEDKAGKINFEPQIQSGAFPDMYGLPVLSIDEPNKPQQKIQQDVKKKVELKKPTDKKVPEKKTVEKKPIEKQKSSIKKTPTLQQKLAAKKVKEPTKKLNPTNSGNNNSKKIIITALIVVPIIVLIAFGAFNLDFVKEKFNSSSEYVGNLLSGNTAELENINDIDTNLVSNTNELDSTQNQTESVLENYTIINAETNESVAATTENLNEFSNVEIIAGSFRRKYYAKRLRNQLNNKGFSSKVLPRSSGLYRVSVGSFKDANEAASEMANIQDLDASLNVWILLNK